MLWWHRWRFRVARRKLAILERAILLGYEKYDCRIRKESLERAAAWHGAHLAESDVAKARVVSP